MAADKPTHWADIQEMAFKRWCNNHLEERGLWIENFNPDFCNGILLINLLEIISHPKKFNKYNKHPRIPLQKTENVNIALDFLKAEGIKLVNIGSSDIVSGNPRLTLGLIWTLILRYQINKGKDGDLVTAKNELLEWVRSKIPEYDIKNFKKDWNDGRALCALNNALNPGCCPDHQSLDPNDKAKNLGRGMGMAEDAFGISPILTPDEMSNPRVDDKAVMAYISEFRDAQKLEKPNDAHKCHAHGPGLVEGVAGKEAPFFVDVPHNNDAIKIEVFGPEKTPEKVTLTQNDKGDYDVIYNPDKPGDYEVHVTFGGVHVPGSVFHVTVLPEISLGGEGKIRVFFSTTSSSEKGRRDVFDLQRLLEGKKVHERPDFEPWCPVDILTREDREAVFEKAGTRNLPIVYVDDKYIGDYDVVQGLEEAGKLDGILKIQK
jgi:filamin